MRKTPDRGRGFSLLEVLVALVLLASVGMALYGWVNSDLISFGRVQDHVERERVSRLALSYLETVNPMTDPVGQQTFGAYRMRWQAELLEEPRQGIAPAGVPSLYRLGLYRVRVEVEHPQRSWQFEFRKVGYVQTHQNMPG